MIIDIGCGENPRGDINIDLVRTPFCNLVSSAEHLPIQSESTDTVLCSEVLEHLEHPKAAISEINRILHANGVAYIDFPKPEFTNNSKYLFVKFVLNFPLSLFPSSLIEIYQTLRGVHGRLPRYHHKRAITIEALSQFFMTLEVEEFHDVFLEALNYGRKAKFFKKGKPRLNTRLRVTCKKSGNGSQNFLRN